MAKMNTKDCADALPSWAFNDRIHQFWEARSGDVFQIPDLIQTAPVVIGRSSQCALCLPDPTCSRRHAELRMQADALTIRDLGSTYGVLINGVRLESTVLTPGDELHLGEHILVAESPRLTELREHLSHYLGYSYAGVHAVGLALRALRATAQCRAVLRLCGDGDLTGFAESLHARILGPARPFVRVTSEPDATSVEDLERAWARAAGGTLCIRNLREAGPFENLLARFRHPTAATQLVLVAPDARLFLETPIYTLRVPSCLERWGEIERVIATCVRSVCASLALDTAWWTDADTRWVKDRDVRSIEAIEAQVHRIACHRHGIDPSPKSTSALRRMTGSLLRFVTNAPYR